MFSPSREQVRRFFCTAWKKRREGAPLAGAESLAAEIIDRHPEYQALLSDTETAVHREWSGENGQINPFLHLSLHLSIAEQLSIDQPQGIRAAFAALCIRHDLHDAEHFLLDCLGKAIWHAQRQNLPIDGETYLECIRRTAGSC